MSLEQLKAFLAKVKVDPSLQEKLKAAKSPDEVSAIAKDHGHEFDDKINDIKISELSEEELENVDGGGLKPTDLCVISLMGAVMTYEKCTCPVDD